MKGGFHAIQRIAVFNCSIFACAAMIVCKQHDINVHLFLIIIIKTITTAMRKTTTTILTILATLKLFYRLLLKSLGL